MSLPHSPTTATPVTRPDRHERPKRARFLAGLALVGAISAVAQAVEVDPPEVPNPWNTGEQRALADHLEERFGIKAPPQATLERLRAMYRAAWNKDQESRLLEGREVDPRFAAAAKRDKENEDRDAIIAEFERNGVHPDHALPTGQLRQKLKELKDEKVAAAAKDADRARQAQAEAAERASLSREAKGAQAGPSVRAIALRPVALAGELPDRQAVLASLGRAYLKPTLTQREREAALAKIERAADQIESVRAKSSLVGISGDGIEVWLELRPDPKDPEYAAPALWFVNLTPADVIVREARMRFAGSTRNADTKETPITARGEIAWAGRCRDMWLPKIYLDPGQAITVDLELSPVP